MSDKQSVLSKTAQAAIHCIAAVLLNLGMVFSAVYILFHLLEYYNPHRFIFPNMPWLPIAIPLLLIVSVLLYDLLFADGAFKKRRFRKGRMWLVILCDLILVAAISAVLYLRTCTTPLSEQDAIEVYQIPTPVATAQPTPRMSDPNTSPAEAPDPSETMQGVDPSSEASAAQQTDPAVMETPDPVLSASAIPLHEKFADLFFDDPVEQVYDSSHVVESLDDGTEKALIYSYRGRNAAVDVYHYQKGKLQYQLADVYVRDMSCFTTVYHSYRQNTTTPRYADQVHAIVATNGDNFNSGKIEDGIVIRNGAQLYPGDGKKQTRFSRDLCVIYADGTMRVYDCVLDRIDYDEILANYPLQAFYFGPKLLNDDGTAKTKFNTSLSKANPRTVLGYYEPGHYALVVVLGTREMVDYNGRNHGNGKSPGMTMADLSALCEQLGFTMAYNLDGGGSSSMVWNKTVFGHNDRTHGDILAVVDP